MKYFLKDSKTTNNEVFQNLKGLKRFEIITLDKDCEVNRKNINIKELKEVLENDEKLVLLKLDRIRKAGMDDYKKQRKNIRKELEIFKKYSIDLDRLNGQLENLNMSEAKEEIKKMFRLKEEDVEKVCLWIEKLKKSEFENIENIRDYFIEENEWLLKGETNRQLSKIKAYISELFLEKIRIKIKNYEKENKLVKKYRENAYINITDIDIVQDKIIDTYEDYDYCEILIFYEKIKKDIKKSKKDELFKSVDLVLKSFFYDDVREESLENYNKYLAYKLKKDLMELIKSEFVGIKLESITIDKFLLNKIEPKLLNDIDNYFLEKDKVKKNLISQKAFNFIKKNYLDKKEYFDEFYNNDLNKIDYYQIKEILKLLCETKKEAIIDLKEEVKKLKFETEKKNLIEIVNNFSNKFNHLNSRKFHMIETSFREEEKILREDLKENLKKALVFENFEEFKLDQEVREEVEENIKSLKKSIKKNLLKKENRSFKEIRIELITEVKEKVELIQKYLENKLIATPLGIYDLRKEYFNENPVRAEKNLILEKYTDLQKIYLLALLDTINNLKKYGRDELHE